MGGGGGKLHVKTRRNALRFNGFVYHRFVRSPNLEKSRETERLARKKRCTTSEEGVRQADGVAVGQLGRSSTRILVHEISAMKNTKATVRLLVYGVRYLFLSAGPCLCKMIYAEQLGSYLPLATELFVPFSSRLPLL